MVFIICIIEYLLSGTWQPLYFRVGIPVFKKSILIKNKINLHLDELNEEFNGKYASPIVFREIKDNVVAFREALFTFRLLSYTPVMHGLIRSTRTKIEVVGYANWYALSFWLLTAYFSFQIFDFEIIFMLFVTVMLGSIYYVQYRRYKRIFEHLKNKDDLNKK